MVRSEDAGIVSDGGVTWAEAEELSKAMGNRECDQTFLAGAPVVDNDGPQLYQYGMGGTFSEALKDAKSATPEPIRLSTKEALANHLYGNSFGRIEGVDVEPARKDDEGKLRWSLLPWRALAKVVEVLEYGAGKYRAHAWVEVESAEDRYKEALLRHVAAFASGELIDPESGKSHLAHIACNALFLLHFSE